MLESAGRKVHTLRKRKAAVVNCLGGVGIIVGIHNNRDRLVILRSSTNHRRPADIDLFHTFVTIRTRRDRFREGVQIHHNKLKTLNPHVFELLNMVWVSRVSQDPRMNFGVQSFDSPVEALRETGELFDERHGDSRIGNMSSGGPRRYDFNAISVEGASQICEPSFVIDADQCAFYGDLGIECGGWSGRRSCGLGVGHGRKDAFRPSEM